MQPLFSALLIASAAFWGERALASPQPSILPIPAAARVAFTSLPPWGFKDEKGQFKGVVVDFVRDLAQDVGLPLREEDVPIARLHHSLSQGKLDLFVSKVPPNGFHCCTSLGKAFESETVVIRKKTGPEWEIPGKEARRICRLGLSGYAVPGYQMFEADSLETCIRMVSRDRLPFAIGERQSLTYILERQAPDVIALFAAPQVLEKKEFHLYITHALDQSAFGPLIRKALLKRKMSDYFSRYAASNP